MLERVPVHTIDPALLDGFHANDPELVAELLADPRPAARNNVVLDWTAAWTLVTDPAELPEADMLDVSVHFARPVPVKLTVLLATGLRLSRSEVTRRTATGGISCAEQQPGQGIGEAAADLGVAVVGAGQQHGTGAGRVAPGSDALAHRLGDAGAVEAGAHLPGMK